MIFVRFVLTDSPEEEFQLEMMLRSAGLVRHLPVFHTTGNEFIVFIAVLLSMWRFELIDSKSSNFDVEKNLTSIIFDELVPLIQFHTIISIIILLINWYLGLFYSIKQAILLWTLVHIQNKIVLSVTFPLLRLVFSYILFVCKK